MKILAIDTATERCSVALIQATGEQAAGLQAGEKLPQIAMRSVDTARGHADIVLSMVAEVLDEAGTALTELDGIAYGRGPGAFTGVRIAVGVVQGLAFGAQRLTVGISNLAAVAQQVAQPGERVLVCMDARMGEIYWATYLCDPQGGLVQEEVPERVGPPGSIDVGAGPVQRIVGTGLQVYPHIAARFHNATAHAGVLPRALEIARLAAAEFAAGRGKSATQAQPVYLRDNVVTRRES